MWGSTQFKQDKKRSKSAPTSVCAVCEKIFSDSLVTQMVIGKFGYQRKYCLRRFSLASLLSIWL